MDEESTPLKGMAETEEPLIKKVDVFKNRVKGGKGTFYRDNRVSGLGVEQYNTLTCAHCQRVRFLDGHGRIIHGTMFKDSSDGRPLAFKPNNKWDTPGFCSHCHARLCENPICNKLCTPVAKMIERNLTYEGIATEPEKYQEIIDRTIFTVGGN